MTFKHFVRLGLFAIATIIGSTSAEAGWHHRYGGSSGGSPGGFWGGSSGGWGSSGGYTVYSRGWGSSGGSWGSSGGSWGGHRGWFHKHRAYYGSSGYGSSGYSTVYYGGSSGGYYGGSSGGAYYGDYDSYPATGTFQATPAVPQNPGATQPSTPPVPTNPAAPANPAAAPGTNPTTFNIQNINSDSVYITVNVPADAKIFVNDRATKSTGTIREYISHGLIAGKQYSYTFRMEHNGKSESKTINVTAGERQQLAFGSENAEVQQAAIPSVLKTTLILEVPENAKVTLAGTDSNQTGTRREFSTDKLAAGEKWENYTIRVETEVNGEIKASEKTVTVNAGDTQTINFNDAPVLTAAR